jgi:hypothetical protein
MKTMLTLAAFAAVALGVSSKAYAVSIYYYLNIDANGAGTWTLTGSTDAPGGIASYAVNLTNVNATATRGAPRWNGPAAVWGFSVGQSNLQPQFDGGGLQAAGGQSLLTEAEDDLGNTVRTVVFGIGAPGGYIMPPNLTWTQVSSTGNPSEVPVLLHRGTYNLGGALPAFAAVQPTESGIPAPGTVWTSVGQFAPIGGADGLVAFYALPEPGVVVLIVTAVPAILLAVYRRSAARR